MCGLREFVKACGYLVLLLMFNRGDMLVQRLDGCCFEEVVGGRCCQALKVVAVDGALVFGGVGFVDILAGYCWGLS